NTLRIIAQIAKSVWDLEAVSVILTRLHQPLTPGCEHLYAPLVELAQPNELGPVREALLNGIGHDSPDIAKGAADALLLKPDLVGVEEASRLDQMLAHWTCRGTWCYRCRVAVLGCSCPSCSVVPSSPRAALVKKLTDLGALAQDRLLILCHDNCI